MTQRRTEPESTVSAADAPSTRLQIDKGVFLTSPYFYRAMFYQLTEKALYGNTGFFNHVRNLEWLIIPPLFTAETFALIIALVVKDCALISWDEHTEASSLCYLIEDHIIDHKKDSWKRFRS